MRIVVGYQSPVVSLYKKRGYVGEVGDDITRFYVGDVITVVNVAIVRIARFADFAKSLRENWHNWQQWQDWQNSRRFNALHAEQAAEAANAARNKCRFVCVVLIRLLSSVWVETLFPQGEGSKSRIYRRHLRPKSSLLNSITEVRMFRVTIWKNIW